MESQSLFSGAKLGRDVRRLQGSLRGPFVGGATRLGFQLRRQALQFYGTSLAFGELILDGYTLQADWAVPWVRGLEASIRVDRERRRGVLREDGSFGGVRGELRWAEALAGIRLGADGWVGHQQPYGAAAGGALVAEVDGPVWGLRVSVSREQELPPMVIGVDRPAPENGIAEYLELFASVEDPETRTAVRLETRWKPGRVGLTLGAWGTQLRNYRIESNPLWVLFSDFLPTPYPGSEANIAGVYTGVELDLGKGVSGRGQLRWHNRGAGEVPYLAPWRAEGSVHWRRWWFTQSLDLDASVGGALLGERRNPIAETYPVTALGYLKCIGRVGNGVLTFTVQNLADSFMEANLRSADTVTPLPVPGRTIMIGLTMYLTE